MAILLFSWLIIQPFLGWETLEKLELKNGYDEFLGEEIEMPVFSKALQSFEGQEVSIEGYVIPLEQSMSQGYFVLSRFPYNNCFFCGNAGPETVAEVYTDREFKFVDTKVRVTGTLELNADDPMHLFFIFNNADVKELD